MKTRILRYSTNTREHHNFITIDPIVSGLIISRLRLIDDKEETIHLEYSRTLEEKITIRYELSIAPLIELTISSSDDISFLDSSNLISVKTGYEVFKKEGSISSSGKIDLAGKRRLKIVSNIDNLSDSIIYAEIAMRLVSVSGLGNIESSGIAKIGISDDSRIVDKVSGLSSELSYKPNIQSVRVFTNDGEVSLGQYTISGKEFITGLDSNDLLYVSYIPQSSISSERINISDDIVLNPDGSIEITNTLHLQGTLYYDLKIVCINPPNILRNETLTIKNLSMVTY